MFTNQLGNRIKNAIEVTISVKQKYSNADDLISLILMLRNAQISGVKNNTNPNNVVRIHRV